jgi:hypothetical protein
MPTVCITTSFKKASCLDAYRVIIKNLFFIFIFFVFAYSLTRFAGTNHLSSLLRHHWQILDIDAISKNPFTSMLYLHSQPPLLNLIIGLLGSLPGDLYQKFIVLNCLCTAITAFVILKLSRYFTRSIYISAIITVLYLMAPSVLLNIGYPFYPSLTSAGYALLLYAFYLSKVNLRVSILILIVAVIYLTLLRGSFSIAHLIFVSVLYFYYLKGSSQINTTHFLESRITIRKKIVICLVMLTPIVIWNTKNLVMYDFWGASSWGPVNMVKGFGIEILPNAFPAPAQIQASMPQYQCSKFYDLIDLSVAKSDGAPNYNSCYYMSFAKAQGKKIFTEYNFKNHLLRMVSHTGQYFSLPDRYEYLTNRQDIENYANIYDSLFLIVTPKAKYEVRVLLFALITVAVFFSFKRKKNRLMQVILILLFMHLFSHVVTDGDEGKRFIFDIEFFFYIIAAYILSEIRDAIKVMGKSASQ